MSQEILLTEQEKEVLQQFGANSGYVEELFKQYLQNPESVSESWRQYFANLRENGAPKQPGAQPQVFESKVEAPFADEKVSPEIKQPPQRLLSIPLEEGDQVLPLRGPAAKIVENMESSLTVPTATSHRIIPVKVLEENRRIINQYLSITNGQKISFTHIIAWAIVQALKNFPSLNAMFVFQNGEPQKILKQAVNLGIAVDIQKKDGSRSLIVPNIKNANQMNFREFVQAYDDIVQRTRKGAIQPADFQGTTVSLTNPGTVGTVSSLPRLMVGQGAIIATGAIQYPAEYHGMSTEAIAMLGISKVMNITCTYDHRIIQGAESGQFLGRIHELLLGGDGFYDKIFEDLDIPHKPFSWSLDYNPQLLGAGQTREETEKQARVLQLIHHYRVRGHLIANLDPLGEGVPYHPELDPAYYGLTIWDLDRKFICGGLGGRVTATLREILQTLKHTYCEKVGIEYMHIQNPEEKSWLQQRLETEEAHKPLDEDTKQWIFRELVAAEGFEKFMHLKFVGHKRFSLEGAEAVIPLLGCLLNDAANQDVREAVIGMAHRGRINVLANIIKKPFAQIFAEFEGILDPYAVHGTGDVKYHLGASGIYQVKDGKAIQVSVVPNPSHLEAVNPVVEGIVRAKQDRLGDLEREQIIPILIHGDAAFAGQGVVQETLNLSQLKGYRTGGTIHIIINNQIGFTTTPEEARSSLYATDVAKMVQAPIFHVNGDDPEAVLRVAKLAFEYRQRFKKDVVIDVVCYRRHGHNEADEPTYTQPLLYKKIREHPSVREIYQKQLLREKVISSEEAEAWSREVRRCLEESYEESRKRKLHFEPDIPLAVSEEELKKLQPAGDTTVEMTLLEKITEALTRFPEGFQVHPKLAPQILRRRKMLFEDKKIDWSFAEALAFGSLLCEGTPVRLSGEDSTRGTFSQRHLILVDINTGQEYIPLNNIMPGQAYIQAFDSLLSEEAVLGFEFGYSVADPLTLVIWEAQFGDFANGAQIMIDNFIAASESKWHQPCDLVLFLPHGYEGQGPEHSSARVERFLQLCAENNLQVCNCTTPAQYFHVLRRQMRDAKRKPLVLLTPKSLLRHPMVYSTPEDLTGGQFLEVLDDASVKDRDQVKRVLICSGKIYYELIEHRQKNAIKNVAIIRIEQLYPYPKEALTQILESYYNANEVVWVQEEPRNMGAWNFIRFQLQDALSGKQKLSYVGRPESASPATGSIKRHLEEQAKVVSEAFGTR